MLDRRRASFLKSSPAPRRFTRRLSSVQTAGTRETLTGQPLVVPRSGSEARSPRECFGAGQRSQAKATQATVLQWRGSFIEGWHSRLRLVGSDVAWYAHEPYRPSALKTFEVTRRTLKCFLSPEYRVMKCRIVVFRFVVIQQHSSMPKSVPPH